MPAGTPGTLGALAAFCANELAGMSVGLVLYFISTSYRLCIDRQTSSSSNLRVVRLC